MLTLSETRRQRHGLVTSIAALSLGIALAGCASSTPAATDAPENDQDLATEVSQDLTADAVSGTGPSEFLGVSFPFPEGAQSVTIAFDCDESGDGFSIELGDSMMLGQSALTGPCGESVDLAWPITAATQPKLTVFVPEGTAWTATPTFSASEFVFDDAVSADCEAYGTVYSAFFNADSGVTFFEAIDDAEWADRVDRATGELATLADNAESELAAAIAEMHQIVTVASPTVGESLAGAEVPMAQIKSTCDLNHTPLIIRGEFGG